MTNEKALHPIAEIRAKHFKPVKPCKIAKIEVIYSPEFSYLNLLYPAKQFYQLMRIIKGDKDNE